VGDKAAAQCYSECARRKAPGANTRTARVRAYQSAFSRYDKRLCELSAACRPRTSALEPISISAITNLINTSLKRGVNDSSRANPCHGHSHVIPSEVEGPHKCGNGHASRRDTFDCAQDDSAVLATPTRCDKVRLNAYNISASFCFSSSIPSPFAAEIGTTSVFGKRFRNAFRFSGAPGRSILFATTNHGRPDSIGS
jgi:hypothetical protein